MKLVKKFDKPTNVLISGAYFETLEPKFGITDDYCEATVVIGNDEIRIETSGFVFVDSIDKFKGLGTEDDSCEAILLEDYVGEIHLIMKYNDKHIEGTSKLDLSGDYIQYQSCVRDECDDWMDVFILADYCKYTKFVNIDNLNEILSL